MAEFFGIELHGNRHRPRLVGEVKSPIQQRFRHRAIDHAGVEMAIAVMVSEPLAERALAGCRRSVDGDDHGSHVRQSGHVVKAVETQMRPNVPRPGRRPPLF
jgi:hypothetical protein